MLARNDVHMNSTELACTVEELKVWFKQGAAEQKAGAVGLDTGFQNAGSGPVASQFNVVPVGAIDRLPPTNPAAPPQHYEIVGRRLTADVVLGAQQEKALSNLNIEGPRVTFQGGGMNVIGTNIHFDREMKLLRIDGEGEMELPIPRRHAGPKMAVSDVLKIHWHKGMIFDGLTVQFQGNVVAATGPQRLCTETMTAKLRRLVDFRAQTPRTSRKSKKSIASTASRWNTASSTYSSDSPRSTGCRSTDLAINVLSGAVTGGPGWINCVRLGTFNPLSLGSAMEQGGQPPLPPGPQLLGVRVKFNKSISGTLPVISPSGGGAPLLNLTFANQVRAAFAPVDRWDSHDFDRRSRPARPQGNGRPAAINYDLRDLRARGRPATDGQAARATPWSTAPRSILRASSPPWETESPTTRARTC